MMVVHVKLVFHAIPIKHSRVYEREEWEYQVVFTMPSSNFKSAKLVLFLIIIIMVHKKSLRQNNHSVRIVEKQLTSTRYVPLPYWNDAKLLFPSLLIVVLIACISKTWTIHSWLGLSAHKNMHHQSIIIESNLLHCMTSPVQ